MSNTLAHPDMGKVRDNRSSVNRPKPETYVVDDATQPTRPPGIGAAVETTIDERLEQFGSPAGPAVETPPVGSETKLPPRVKTPLTKALEKLIFIGRVIEVVEISGVKFEISTLTNREHTEIIRMMYSFAEPADLFTIRLLTMANALKTIDGVSLDDIDIEGEFESSLHRRMSILDHLQLSVLEELYEAYEKLTKEEEQLGDEDEQVKNS